MMVDQRSESPMRIRLSDDRRIRVLDSLKRHFADHFDESLSDCRARGLIDFFVRELGPPVYNQAIRDATAFLQDKLTDLEGEIYEPEFPNAR